MTIGIRSTDYLNHVQLRNMYRANWRNSCIGALNII